MITVADIAKQAFDAVTKAIDGVVFEGTLTYSNNDGSYDTDTGTYSDSTTSTDDCRVIVSKTQEEQETANYEFEAGDKLIIVEGLTVQPVAGMHISFNANSYEIKFIENLLDADGMYSMVVR